MRLTTSIFLVLACLSLASCATVHPAAPASIQLLDAKSSIKPLGYWLAQSKYTVVVFVSAKCPCVRAHAERIRALSERYAPSGVKFIAVDSEFDATPKIADSERQANGWGFPVLLDQRGVLADRLGAEFASHSAILDANGRVHYQGGIDSDRKHMHGDATPHLANALYDVLAGREPRVARTEALGCVLRRH